MADKGLTAQIRGVMRALNRHVERVFNPDRKEAALPEERPRCGAGYAGTAPSS